MLHKFCYNPARHKIGAVIRTDDSSRRFAILKLAIDKLLEIDEISLISVAIYHPIENSELRLKLIEEYGREKKRIEFVGINSGNFSSDILA